MFGNEDGKLSVDYARMSASTGQIIHALYDQVVRSVLLFLTISL